MAAPGGASGSANAVARIPEPAPHSAPVSPTAIDDPEPAIARRQTFGPRLKAARERSGISLEQIATRTKVSASLLAALERGDLSRWPKGIFRRAFLRDYATAIGLPAEPCVAEFLELYPDGESHPATLRPAEGRPARLRLTLAPPPGLTRSRFKAAAIEPAVIIAIASAAAWWLGGGPYTALGVIALAYYQRAISAVRARRAKWPGARPSEAPPEAPRATRHVESTIDEAVPGAAWNLPPGLYQSVD